MELQSASQIVAQTQAAGAPVPTALSYGPAPSICTGCDELDVVLGRWRGAHSWSAASPAGACRRGLPSGTALEILGPTAVGKSRLAAQVAVRWAQDMCSFPPEEWVYVIDIEGSLSPESLVHTVGLLQDEGQARLPAREVIARIRYTRVTSATQLVALLQTLGDQYTRSSASHPFPAMLERPQRCLVVLDSLDECLRGQFSTSLRSQLRTSYTEFAAALAARGVSLVATNGMGIKVTRDAGGLLVPIATGQTEFGPTAGGDDDLRNWRSLLGKERVCRLLLSWDPRSEPGGDVRSALVFPRLDAPGGAQLWNDPGQRVPFAIGLDGRIRAMGS